MLSPTLLLGGEWMIHKYPALSLFGKASGSRARRMSWGPPAAAGSRDVRAEQAGGPAVVTESHRMGSCFFTLQIGVAGDNIWSSSRLVTSCPCQGTCFTSVSLKDPGDKVPQSGGCEKTRG